jgi:hypothetical protein
MQSEMSHVSENSPCSEYRRKQGDAMGHIRETYRAVSVYRISGFKWDVGMKSNIEEFPHLVHLAPSLV